MKALLTVVSILLLVQFSLLSQPCLPEGITFTTQAQIDSFQINYPGCTEIEGNVKIEGDIYNIEGLSVLTSIGGYCTITSNDSLVSLNGLDNLSIIEGSFLLEKITL